MDTLFSFLYIFQFVNCYLTVNCKVDVKEAKEYLRRFGYEPKVEGRAELQSNIERFQTFANIPVTGRLDERTIKQMAIPRCGMKDPLIVGRYQKQGTKWNKNLLTWRLYGNSRTLSRNVVLHILTSAFGMWSKHSKLDFRMDPYGTPDIAIKFSTRLHDGPHPFDGKGGVLAHAFYPLDNKGFSGDIHFDNDEDFTFNSKYGHNLLWVATHEIGHSLGLQHSKKKDSLMYPWYVGFNDTVDLTKDDIDGITSIYGKRVTPPRNIPCPVGKITAVYDNRQIKLLLAFTDKEQVYFIEDGTGIKYGPVPINNVFRGIDITQVDAAMYIKDDENGSDKTILFSGDSYYIYHLFKFVSGPHSIHQHNPLNIVFPAWVGKIDAVFTWSRDERVYIFVHQYYWRYDIKTKTFDYGYPRKIRWKVKVDAAYSDTRNPIFVIDKSIFIMDNWTLGRRKKKHVACEFFNCGGQSFAEICTRTGDD